MNIEEIKFWITLGLGAIGVITSLFQWIKRKIELAKQMKKLIEEQKWEELKTLLRSELIPLMEQAEKDLTGAEEKENWVIKKLSDKVHVDFFIHKNILNLAKEIIAEICKTTKIDVNKIIVIEEKKEIIKEEKENVIY